MHCLSDKRFNFQVGLEGTKNRDASLDPDFQSCRLNPACFHAGKQVEYTHTQRTGWSVAVGKGKSKSELHL